MTSEILLSARKLFCTLMLFSTSVDCLLSLMDECGDFLVERGVGRTSLEGSGEEGTWPALAGRSLCRIKHTIKVQPFIQPFNFQPIVSECSTLLQCSSDGAAKTVYQ